MKLEAIKPCVYYGNEYKPGQKFDVEERWARVFVGLGRAVAVKALEAEQPDESPKRTYKRKDMAGEGITK